MIHARCVLLGMLRDVAFGFGVPCRSRSPWQICSVTSMVGSQANKQPRPDFLPINPNTRSTVPHPKSGLLLSCGVKGKTCPLTG